jgi:7-cyano-7-deazaguanine synthase
MEREKIAILFSGGLESTALIKYYKNKKKDITLIYLFFGYVWEDAEFFHAKKIASKYKLTIATFDLSKVINTIQLGNVKNLKENIIPLRNLSLLTLSSLFIYNKNIYKLAIGIQGNLEYPDTSKRYIKNIEKLISIGLSKSDFQIEVPFYGKKKEEIIKEYSLPLELIFSCTNPINYKRCHTCYKCKKLDYLIKKYS